MTGVEELKKYLKPSYLYLYSSAVFMLLGIVGVIGTKSVFVFLFLGGIEVLHSWSTIMLIINLKEQIQHSTENGTIGQIVEEFQNARSYTDTSVRLGPAHVFGEKSGIILEYKDIAKVYQYIHKTYFSEDRRQLRVETKDGRLIILCKLAIRGQADESVKAIVKEMLSHNPGIKIGYK